MNIFISLADCLKLYKEAATILQTNNNLNSRFSEDINNTPSLVDFFISFLQTRRLSKYMVHSFQLKVNFDLSKAITKVRSALPEDTTMKNPSSRFTGHTSRAELIHYFAAICAFNPGLVEYRKHSYYKELQALEPVVELNNLDDPKIPKQVRQNKRFTAFKRRIFYSRYYITALALYLIRQQHSDANAIDCFEKPLVIVEDIISDVNLPASNHPEDLALYREQIISRLVITLDPIP